jgi:deaminated glutathione amidase
VTRAAVIQMTSGAEVAGNLQMTRELLQSARSAGATLAVLPENFALMGRLETDKLAVAESPGNGPIQDCLSACARDLELWIVGGTLPMRVAEQPNKVAAASLVYDTQGHRVGRYDKIHLFDVDLPLCEERYRESATIARGAAPQVLETPLGQLGLSVCYDVRFPELFRHLQQSGAQLFSVPAAFTVPTGQAHWELLLRARAVENLCYVLAPAQSGRHANGRETWGHSMIVGPWGEVLACVTETGPGLAVAEIDLMHQQQLRERFPALNHRLLRSF